MNGDTGGKRDIHWKSFISLKFHRFVQWSDNVEFLAGSSFMRHWLILKTGTGNGNVGKTFPLHVTYMLHAWLIIHKNWSKLSLCMSPTCLVHHSQKLPKEECCHLSFIDDILEKCSGNMAVFCKISTQVIKVVTGDPVLY